MKAAVYTQYGSPDVLQIKDIAKPTPKDNEVLVKVQTTTVTIGDCRMRSFTVPRWQWLPARLYLGVFRPRRTVLGMELSGEVEAVGKNVTQYKPGDAVFSSTMKSNFGGHAEYKCLVENEVMAVKPASITFEQAAAGLATGGVTALLNLRKANIQPGQHVLIYGASGSVGTFAVQLARHFGAEVTAVCSTRNIDLMQSLGADHVMDYTRDDFTRSGQTYDVIFDAVGKLPAAQGKKALKPSGIYMNVNNTSGSIQAQDLVFLAELMAAGKLKPVIDRCYPLAQIVEAHRYVDQGHKKGNVVITVA